MTQLGHELFKWTDGAIQDEKSKTYNFLKASCKQQVTGYYVLMPDGAKHRDYW